MKYFISYYYKSRWGKTGVGSVICEFSEPITDKNYEEFIDILKIKLKVKNLVILNYKELKGGENDE